MSGYLLDTNVLLFVMEDDHRLTSRVREVVAQGKNVISVVSYWEVTIKTMKGNVDVGIRVLGAHKLYCSCPLQP